jgi:hypothetical protein
MSFMNQISRFSLFLPEAVKIDFESTKRASDVKGVKWKKAAKIRDQVFLDTGIPPRQIHQELLTTFGSDTYSEDSVRCWLLVSNRGIRVAKASRYLADPLQLLAKPFRLVLQHYLFASPRMLIRRFSVCATTAKEILVRDLGLKDSLDDGHLIHCPTLKNGESRGIK